MCCYEIRTIVFSYKNLAHIKAYFKLRIKPMKYRKALFYLDKIHQLKL